MKNGSQIYTDEEIVEPARAGKTTERHQGTSQDIGLAIDKDPSFSLNIFIVQTRPQTVWIEPMSEFVLGNRGSLSGIVSSDLNTTKTWSNNYPRKKWRIFLLPVCCLLESANKLFHSTLPHYYFSWYPSFSLSHKKRKCLPLSRCVCLLDCSSAS